MFPAPCAVVQPWEAFIIGAIGGLIAVVGVIMFDKLKIDDPVGAISVHGLSGIWVNILLDLNKYINKFLKCNKHI